MIRAIGIFVLAAVMSACSVEPPTSQTGASSAGTLEASSASSNETTSEASSEELGITSEAITPFSCVITLNFCDAPGSIGTECTESAGCLASDLPSAITVCKQLVAGVGCSVLCDAVIRNSAGTVIDTFRQSCGGKCCAEGTFCFNGNRCCPSDGPPVAGCPVQ